MHTDEPMTRFFTAPAGDPFIPARPWTGGKAPRRILAIRLQATGDVVITLPYLQDLRRRLPPGTELDLLTRRETADIPRHTGLFGHVYALGGARDFKKQLCLILWMLPRLAIRRYDVVLDLQRNPISRLVTRVLRPRAWSVFDKYSPRAAGERTRLTIEAAGLGPSTCDTAFAATLGERGRQLLQAEGWDGSDALVILNPASAFPTRRWPLSHYTAFARLWKTRFPRTRFIVLGTPFIAAQARYFQKELGSWLIHLVGNTGPFDAFSVIQHCTLVLSEDSGLMHMGWVSGAPTLALFGGTRSDWARPLGPHTRFLDSSDLPCGNCMQEICPLGTVHCLTRYTPEKVFSEALALLAQSGRNPILRHAPESALTGRLR